MTGLLSCIHLHTDLLLVFILNLDQVFFFLHLYANWIMIGLLFSSMIRLFFFFLNNILNNCILFFLYMIVLFTYNSILYDKIFFLHFFILNYDWSFLIYIYIWNYERHSFLNTFAYWIMIGLYFKWLVIFYIHDCFFCLFICFFFTL